MESSIIVAIISGIITILGTLITVWAGLRTSAQKAAIQQAITDTKLDELTREVRKHNGFAESIPVIQEQIKVIDNRVSNLEKEVSNGKPSN